MQLRLPFNNENILSPIGPVYEGEINGYAYHSPLAWGSNPRYIVTNLVESPQHLYDAVYCARGDMDNLIKEQQFVLFDDRTSCHHWWPSQSRMLLSAFPHVLINTIRRIGLTGTALARAYVRTIHLKLLKIAAVVLRNTCGVGT